MKCPHRLQQHHQACNNGKLALANRGKKYAGKGKTSSLRTPEENSVGVDFKTRREVIPFQVLKLLKITHPFVIIESLNLKFAIQMNKYTPSFGGANLRSKDFYIKT